MDVHVDWIRTGWIRRSPGGDDDDHDNNPTVLSFVDLEKMNKVNMVVCVGGIYALG